MKKFAIYALLSGALLFSGCATEDDITPNVDTTPEYEELLKVTESSSDADKKIYEWYQKYNTAFLYKFEDNDFSWLWTSKFNRTYVKFDPSNEEDMAMLDKQLGYIQTKLLDMYDEETLKNSLPYKVFLVKELRSTANATSSLSSKVFTVITFVSIMSFINTSLFANSKYFTVTMPSISLFTSKT